MADQGFSFFTDIITPTKYKVAKSPSVDLSQEQLNNDTGNYAAYKGAVPMATDYNAFMRAETMKGLQSVPGLMPAVTQWSKNLEAQLRGEMPTSDVAATQRSSVARALGLGVGPGELTARNLGLSQFQVQQSAQSQMPGFAGTSAAITRAPTFDFSGVFTTPMQRAQVSMWNEENRWNVQNLENQMAVQPEPWMKALAGAGDYYTNYINNLASSFIGGKMGGGFGGGGGAAV